MVVRHSTGIIYGTQCDGTSTDERMVEGYFIPLGGAAFGPESGPIDVEALDRLFHRSGGCRGTTWASLSAEQRDQLRALVEDVPCWWTPLDGEHTRAHLELDQARLVDLVEAWIPVVMPHGTAVLLHHNCD